MDSKHVGYDYWFIDIVFDSRLRLLIQDGGTGIGGGGLAMILTAYWFGFIKA